MSENQLRTTNLSDIIASDWEDVNFSSFDRIPSVVNAYSHGKTPVFRLIGRPLQCNVSYIVGHKISIKLYQNYSELAQKITNLIKKCILNKNEDSFTEIRNFFIENKQYVEIIITEGSFGKEAIDTRNANNDLFSVNSFAAVPVSPLWESFAQNKKQKLDANKAMSFEEKLNRYIKDLKLALGKQSVCYLWNAITLSDSGDSNGRLSILKLKSAQASILMNELSQLNDISGFYAKNLNFSNFKSGLFSLNSEKTWLSEKVMNEILDFGIWNLKKMIKMFNTKTISANQNYSGYIYEIADPKKIRDPFLYTQYEECQRQSYQKIIEENQEAISKIKISDTEINSEKTKYHHIDI